MKKTNFTVLVVALAMTLTSCFDPQSLRIRFQYSGNREGMVFILIKNSPSNLGETMTNAFVYRTVEGARVSNDGSPAQNSSGQLYFRSDFESRRILAQAWIDLDGDDIARCQLGERGGGSVTPDCGPEAGDPSGITPPPPFGATIPLVIRDPNL